MALAKGPNLITPHGDTSCSLLTACQNYAKIATTDLLDSGDELKVAKLKVAAVKEKPGPLCSSRHSYAYYFRGEGTSGNNRQLEWGGGGDQRTAHVCQLEH